MGAITASNVTNIQTWRQPRQGGPNMLHRILDIALSGNGGTADDIPASLLGFNTIYSATSVRYLVTSGSTLARVPVVLEADGAGILTVNLADATDATRPAPANVAAAGTLRVYLIGLESN